MPGSTEDPTPARSAAQAAHRAALTANAAGHPGEAASRLAEALLLLAPLSDPDSIRLRCRVLLTQAVCRFEESGRADAELILHEVGEMIGTLRDRELTALWLSQRANVAGRSGDLDTALTLLNRASAHLGALAPRDHVTILINRALMGSQCGLLADAEEDLGAAADLAHAQGLPELEFMALHNQGWLHYLRGDLPAALAAFRRADEVPVDVARGIASLDRGRVLLEAGLIEDALPILRRAVTECDTDRLGHAAIEARYELSRARLVIEDRQGLARAVADAAETAAGRAATGWELRLRLLTVRVALTESEPQLADHQHWLDLPGDDPMLCHESALLKADLALRSGDLAAAARALGRAQAITESGIPVPLSSRLDEHRLTATHLSHVGDIPQARRVLRRAAALLSSSRSRTASIELRAARQLHGRALAELDIDLALAHGPAQTLQAVERWRARSTRLAHARPETDQTVAQRLAEVRRLAEQIRGSDTDGSAEVRATRLAKLAESEQAAAEAARAAAGTPRHLSEPPVVSPHRLPEALRAENAYLLSLVDHSDHLLGIGVSAHDHHWVDLGDPAAIVETARRLRADLAASTRVSPTSPLLGSVVASMRLAATELGRLLLPGHHRRYERLVVVPSATLAGLPWTLIGDGCPVTVAPSATVWVHAVGHGETGEPHARRPARPQVAQVTGPGLAAAAAEEAAVRRAWPSVRTADGTAAGLADVLGSADLVHVTAHGHHHAENPMFSRVDLSGGPAYLYDLESAALTARKVILAACDAGKSEIRSGNEPLGLCAGLLALGIPSVTAAVTRVPDDLTAALMADLHRRLAGGVPSDVALAEAAGTFVAEPLGPLARCFGEAGAAW